MEDDNAFTDFWRIARSWRKGHSLPSQTPDRTCNPKQSPVGQIHIGLKKAFNTLPRWPIVFLWRKLGIPQWVCDFWLHSLMRMQRFPHLHGCLGSPVESTTGTPEGNSLTVVAMLAPATAFHWSITKDAPTVMLTTGGGLPSSLKVTKLPFCPL